MTAHEWAARMFGGAVAVLAVASLAFRFLSPRRPPEVRREW